MRSSDFDLLDLYLDAFTIKAWHWRMLYYDCTRAQIPGGCITPVLRLQDYSRRLNGFEKRQLAGQVMTFFFSILDQG